MSLLPDSVITLVRQAHQIVALTGGGVASEAKFPSFRESHTGEWARYDVSELATPQAFQRNPRLVWEWYAHRRRVAEQIHPGPTHQALAALERFNPNITIVTQAIDGLHTRAGSTQVIELNGSLLQTRCFEAGHIVNTWEHDDIPPRCPHCGSFLRPDVVMFGEGLAQTDLRRARAAVDACDLFLALGTIATIEPVSSFPIAARKARAHVVAITHEEDSIYTVLADEIISAAPGEVLPILALALLNQSR